MQAAGGLRALGKRMAGAPRSFVPTLHVRGMAGEFRPREQKLLEVDPALKDFKSGKAKIRLIRRFGDVLTVAIVVGSAYEFYYRIMAKKAAEEPVKGE